MRLPWTFWKTAVHKKSIEKASDKFYQAGNVIVRSFVSVALGKGYY